MVCYHHATILASPRRTVKSVNSVYHKQALLLQKLHRANSVKPPRNMSAITNPIYFIHIPKTGGTSLQTALKQINEQLNATRYIKVGQQNHFDWSYLTSSIQQHDLNKIHIVTFLRNPIDRSVSQFHYAKELAWVKKLVRKRKAPHFYHQTYDEYVSYPNKTWLQPLADGEGGVEFLAGTFATDSDWVTTDGIESEEKLYLRRNKTAQCLLAAHNLDQTGWFGLLEEKDRSMKLLSISLNLTNVPELPQKNPTGRKRLIGGKRHGMPKRKNPSNETLLQVKKYLPQDLWFYEYAKLLFEARWKHANGGIYIHPELPPLPDFSG